MNSAEHKLGARISLSSRMLGELCRADGVSFDALPIKVQLGECCGAVVIAFISRAPVPMDS
jgi:hypothetical protein